MLAHGCELVGLAFAHGHDRLLPPAQGRIAWDVSRAFVLMVTKRLRRRRYAIHPAYARCRRTEKSMTAESHRSPESRRPPRRTTPQGSTALGNRPRPAALSNGDEGSRGESSDWARRRAKSTADARG